MVKRFIEPEIEVDEENNELRKQCLGELDRLVALPQRDYLKSSHKLEGAFQCGKTNYAIFQFEQTIKRPNGKFVSLLRISELQQVGKKG